MIGFLLVILDFRFDGFDLIPDLLGWVIVLAGLMPLAGRSRGFAAAGAAAAVGVLLALPQQLSEPGPVIGLLEAVAETVLLFGTCTGVIALVADPQVRRTANRIRGADGGRTAVATAVSLAAGGGTAVSVDEAMVLPLLVLVLVGLGIVVWFLLFLWSHRHRPELVSGLGTGEGPAPGTP